MIEVKCQCGARYRVSEKMAGKRAKCKHCGEAIPIPAVREEPEAREGGSLFDDLPTAAGGTYSIGEAVETAPAAPIMDQHVPLRAEAATSGARGFGGFWKDAGRSFLFVKDLGALVTFLIAGVLIAMLPLLEMAGCYGLIGTIVVLGWLAGFLFNVMTSAAGGERELPSITATDGVFDDIVVPLFKFVGAVVICGAPAFAYGAYLGSTALPDETIDFDTGITLALNGLSAFMWPMVVLVIGLGGFSALLRVDLIVATIGRTFVPYLATVLVTMGAEWLGTTISEELQFNTAVGGQNPMAISMVLLVLLLYLSVAAMRVIGLYYHHFKDRFAWSWG